MFCLPGKMEIPLGLRFIPTEEEIVDHYLRLKNLGGNTSRVDEVMSTVDIYSFDPWELPSQSTCQSMMEPGYLVWYFFGGKMNQQNRGERQSRKTKSGSWKKTGETTDIERKRGNHEKIGEKRVFMFKSNTLWVMHEYVATTFLPPNQTTYTVCKIIFKGDARDLSSSSSSSSSSSAAAAAGEIENIHSLIPLVNDSSGGMSTGTEGSSFDLHDPRQFSSFLHLEEETHFENDLLRVINDLPVDALDGLFDNDV